MFLSLSRRPFWRTIRRRFEDLSGLAIGRHHPLRRSEDLLVHLLATMSVDTVLDIGANTGQFARALLRDGYQGEVLSFEPLEREHAALTRLAADEARWSVFRRAAVGDEAGTILIQRAANSVSSSPLPIREAHVRADPTSRTVGTELAEALPLDSVSHPVLDRARRVCIKMDVQGYERQVLAGAASFLASREVPVLFTEMSLVELYEGQTTFLDHLILLRSLGFEPFHLQPGFSDESTGQTLQLDAVFLRKGDSTDRTAS